MRLDRHIIWVRGIVIFEIAYFMSVLLDLSLSTATNGNVPCAFNVLEDYNMVIQVVLFTAGRIWSRIFWEKTTSKVLWFTLTCKMASSQNAELCDVFLHIGDVWWYEKMWQILAMNSTIWKGYSKQCEIIQALLVIAWFYPLLHKYISCEIKHCIQQQFHLGEANVYHLGWYVCIGIVGVKGWIWI